MIAKPSQVTESDIIFSTDGLEYMLMTIPDYLQLSDGIRRQQDKVVEYLHIIAEHNISIRLIDHIWFGTGADMSCYRCRRGYTVLWNYE